jgi:hypothetical protein
LGTDFARRGQIAGRDQALAKSPRGLKLRPVVFRLLVDINQSSGFESDLAPQPGTDHECLRQAFLAGKPWIDGSAGSG